MSCVNSSCVQEVFLILNSNNLRWMDKNIGRLICFLLTVFRKVFCVFTRDKTSKHKPSKILFIKFIEQGSIVLAYPAIKKAIELVGKDYVYFLLLKQNRPILDILNILPEENIIEVEFSNFLKTIVSLIKALFCVRRKKIDAIIDLELFMRTSAIFAYLSGARTKVGLHNFTVEGLYRGDLFTHKLIYNPYMHTKLLFVSLIEALKHKPAKGNNPMIFEIPSISDGLPLFSPAQEQKQTLKEKIEQIKQSTLDRPVVIFNPNTSELLPIRRWPVESFIELGNKIMARYPQATIIITGNTEEKEKAEQFALELKGAVCLAGKTSIRELLTLYALADVLVTNDSGPAHFATLTTVKSVIFFGPETPILYTPKGERTNVIGNNLICSPCINVYNQRNSPCKEGTCLKNISPGDVFENIRGILGY